MNTHTETLGLVERRGILTYASPLSEAVTLEGWFMLSNDGQGVIRRKVGGRNRYLVCALSAVIAFDGQLPFTPSAKGGR